MRLLARIVCLLCLLLGCASCKTPDSRRAQNVEFSLAVGGEVHNPGVYSLRPDDTIQIAVTRAGGAYDWPPKSGVRKPVIATVKSGAGTTTRVMRREWSRYLLKPGDKITIDRNWL